jgi:hypothetical protein
MISPYTRANQGGLGGVFDKITGAIEWAQGLPNVPKGVISGVVILIAVFVVALLWTKPASKAEDPAKASSVVDAYGRMVRILDRLSISPDGNILQDGSPVRFSYIDTEKSILLKDHAEIVRYIKYHPNDIKGDHEEIWNNGGESRVFTDDTNTFENVVSSFFREYSEAEKASKGAPTDRP